MNLRRVLEGKVWEGIHGLCMGENRFSSFGSLYACKETLSMLGD